MDRSFGFMGLQDAQGNTNAIQFAVRQIMRAEVCTAMIVKIVSVDTSARTVDVQAMVDQVTPDGTTITHGTIHEVPYGYEQGGVCLIKIDPAVGDIGVAVFAHRDITRVKRTQAAAAPQTLRTHNYADALYVRTLWAASAPAHEIVFDPTSGITITSSQTVTINANLKVNGTGTFTGDVTAGGISLESHVHTGVQSGSSTTGKPE